MNAAKCAVCGAKVKTQGFTYGIDIHFCSEECKHTHRVRIWNRAMECARNPVQVALIQWAFNKACEQGKESHE